MVVVRPRDQQGNLHVTVAEWGNGWRLDRVIFADQIHAKRRAFELIDESCPGEHREHPIWLSYAPGKEGGPWRLTENWPEAVSDRRAANLPPVELLERAVGLRIALDGSPPEGGFLFRNFQADDSVFYVPHLLRREVLRKAKETDSAIAKVDQLQLHRSVPTVELLSTHLGTSVREVTPRVGLQSRFAIEIGDETELMVHHSSSYHPRWGCHPLMRTLGGNSLFELLFEGLRRDLFVLDQPAEQLRTRDQWMERASVPKLLLDPEEVSVYRVLGEELPILWADEAFLGWLEDLLPSGPV